MAEKPTRGLTFQTRDGLPNGSRMGSTNMKNITGGNDVVTWPLAIEKNFIWYEA